MMKSVVTFNRYSRELEQRYVLEPDEKKKILSKERSVDLIMIDIIITAVRSLASPLRCGL